MSQVLRISLPPHNSIACCSSTKRSSSSVPLHLLYGSYAALLRNPSPGWAALQRKLRCKPRYSCLLGDNRRKQEEARKAIENALGEKKNEFEKWSKNIEKGQGKSGRGASGRGGWSGGGGWFGWFGGGHFWEEARQAILTIVGIIALFLLVTKGDVIFAFLSNSLRFGLRNMQNWLNFMSSCLSRGTSGSKPKPLYSQATNEMHETQMSAKERVVKKWGMD